MNDKTLILVAGGTASGKTMIAEQVQQQYEKSGADISLISLDNYYKTLDQFGVSDHSDVNWDDPNSFDWERVRKDMNSLLNGDSITIQQYNYGTGYYDNEPIVVESTNVIILEGLYSLYDEEIRKLAGVSIFVDVDADVRLIRRIKRDSEGRYSHNWDSSAFLKKWEKEIKPMHKKFIKPTIDYADLIVKNNKELREEEKSSLIGLLQTLVVK